MGELASGMGFAFLKELNNAVHGEAEGSTQWLRVFLVLLSEEREREIV